MFHYQVQVHVKQQNDCCLILAAFPAFLELYSFGVKIILANSYLIMEGMSPTDYEERPSLVRHEIEPMDNERRQRIDDVIGNIEGVTTDLDESKSRSIKDLIGELRQLVKNLSDVGPALCFFDEKVYPMNMNKEKQECLEALEVQHREDYIDLAKEYHEAEEDVRRLYGRTERRRRLDVFFKDSRDGKN